MSAEIVLGASIDKRTVVDGQIEKITVEGEAALEVQAVGMDALQSEFGVTRNTLTDSLPDEHSNSTISLKLKQVYFYKECATGSDSASVIPSKFALWVDLVANGITENWPVTVSEVSAKLWTSNTPKKVLNQMNIIKMNKLMALGERLEW